MEKTLEELKKEERKEEEKLKEIRTKITELQKSRIKECEGKYYHEKEDETYEFYYKVLKVHTHGRWNGEHWCLNPAQATVLVIDNQWQKELNEDCEDDLAPFSIEIIILDEKHGFTEWEEITESEFQTVLEKQIKEIKKLLNTKKDKKNDNL